MTFSVLLAVYIKDNPVFLEECLQSLFAQTVKMDSVVLVKDGPVSSEVDAVIIKWEEKLPLKVVGYEQNKGLASALNFGLQFVETDYVARMDSDDICYKNRFEKQIEFLQSNPEIAICSVGITEFYIDKNGNRLEKVRLYNYKTDKSFKGLFKGTPIAHPTLFIKTELLKEYMYAEDTSMNEDIDLWFRFLLDGHIIYTIQEPLLYFRITDGTFRRRSVKKAFAEYKIYYKYLRRIFGKSPMFIWPLIRFITRFFPYSINKKLYFSDIRTKFFSK